MTDKVFGNLEWSDSTRNYVGLPRPFSKVSKIYRNKSKLGAKVPIPWQSAVRDEQGSFLRIVQENEDIVYYSNLCSYCGISIDDNENVVKWNNPNMDKITHDSNFVFSDIHPLHLECMRQTRIFCPGMKQRTEKEFEYGLYLNLKNNSQKERRFIMDKNILTSVNLFYFTADWCQPCKKIKPIIQEINRDKTGLKFHMIDADIEKELVQRFKIQSLPTFITVYQGKEITRLVGAQTKEKLQEFLNFAERGQYEEIIQKDL
jgi:thioredoxin 1